MPPETRRRTWIGAALLAVAGLAVLWTARAEVVVRVRNAGTSVLREVVVLTTGHRTAFGHIGPGSEVARPVDADGEPHVELEWRDATDAPRRHVVDCSFEGGRGPAGDYDGCVDVEIRGAVVVASSDVGIAGPLDFAGGLLREACGAAR